MYANSRNRHRDQAGLAAVEALDAGERRIQAGLAIDTATRAEERRIQEESSDGAQVVTMWALRGAAEAFVTLLARCFPGAPSLGLDA